MKIRYRTPSWWPPLQDWLNVDVYKRIRRIDLILIGLGTFCTVYYAMIHPVWWQGALVGAAGFVFFATMALVFKV